MLYTPLINKEGNVMCMHWDINSPYQKYNTKLNSQLIDFFFEREIKFLNVFKEKSWAPEIYEIDTFNKKIFIEWNKETVNDIAYGENRNLDKEFPNWQEQLYNILEDIVKSGNYKMALYTHCFFFDKYKKLKTFDFYSCIGIKERYLEKKQIEGMLGNDSSLRFNEATTNGLIDFEIFFKRTLSTHLKWPGDPLPSFYRKIFNE
jgi:hypothetical protein